jgi:hypothetical protein
MNIWNPIKGWAESEGGITMNEWDKLHRQAERYKAEYPPGTRIMINSY